MTIGTRARLAIGRAIDRLEDLILSSSLFPLTRYVPHGHSCWYDIQRFASTRELASFSMWALTLDSRLDDSSSIFNACIYCFEPGSDSYKKLHAVYGWSRNVHCIPMALGGAFKMRRLSTNPDSELNTLVVGESVAIGSTPMKSCKSAPLISSAMSAILYPSVY